jgi:ligand-binding sensor domain-containing protein
MSLRLPKAFTAYTSCPTIRIIITSWSFNDIGHETNEKARLSGGFFHYATSFIRNSRQTPYIYKSIFNVLRIDMYRSFFFNKSIVLLLGVILLMAGGTKGQPSFQQFTRFNSPLPDNTCNHISIDNHGRKWFCTEYGLAVYNDTTWTVYQTLNSGLSDNSVKHVSFDQQQNAWISTQNGGLCRFDGTSWTVYNTLNSSITSDFVRSTAVDRFGHVWICTNNGLNYFDGTNWNVYDISNSGIPVNNITVIALENDSVRWIGTMNGGFVRMIDTAFTVWDHYANNFPDNTISGLIIDDANIKWTTCPAGALVRFFNGNAFAYNTGSSLIPSNTLTTLQADSAGDFWIGSFDKGLIKRVNNDYYYWCTQNSAMPEDIVYGVAVERNGLVWCGTSSQGVVRFVENISAGIGSVLEPDPFHVFPNPARDFIRVVSEKSSLLRAVLYNTVGEKVLETICADGSNARLETSGLAAGCYFLSMETPRGAVTRKILVAE